MDTVDSLTLPQQVTLLATASLDRDDETPAKVNVITRSARQYTEDLPEIGKLTEAEVDRALNTLEAEEFVSTPATEETSPVGKGRPAFEPVADADELLAELGDQPTVGSLLEQPDAA